MEFSSKARIFAPITEEVECSTSSVVVSSLFVVHSNHNEQPTPNNERRTKGGLKMLKSKYLPKTKYLTKKQKGVLEDLFSGRLDEEEILEKWKVRRRTYHRWHGQEIFAAEFNRLLKLAQSQSELIFARYTADVAAKLVSLAGTEKEDIARKACMYVINHPDRKGKNLVESPKLPETEPPVELPPEVASRLLAALARE
jgi:hypothetical protein